MKLKERRQGFTLAGLISVLSVVMLLSLVFMPRLPSIKNASERARCLNNLRQVAVAMHLYTEDNYEFFPPQTESIAEGLKAGWWGSEIKGYTGDQTNLFRCPVLKGPRTDRGTRWQWRFDVHQLGYGYNAFFLGLHPYQSLTVNVGGVPFVATPSFKRSSVVRPAQNLLLGESSPYGTLPRWGGVLWWPNACMDERRSTARTWEGVDTDRHSGTGATAFNDGHVEFRRDQQINPPYDPISGNPNALINANYWDPLQRGR